MVRPPSSLVKIGGQTIGPGERKNISLNVARTYDFTEMSIPIEVIRGQQPGPRLFISAAIHGDEINGVEIIRRLLTRIRPQKLKGTLIAVPVVNVFGFNSRSRYLPDRRDLNRSFPGSSKGSLAGRMAHIFMKEIVRKSTHGIDLHTGAVHRTNLPQIRASLDEPETKELAEVFGAPVILNSKLRDGSLREAARKRKVPTLLFEGGEALRFEESIIRAGVKGCWAVMQKIGMLPRKTTVKKRQAFIAQDSFWVRAPQSGSLRTNKSLGDRVQKNEIIAYVQDLFGREQVEITANEEGIIIGQTQFPLLNRGDAVFHIATFKNLGKVSSYLRQSEADLFT